MKFNKWTMGLAAVGVVSLASAARADETPMSQVQTALSNTTLSGYVDTSAMWQLGSQNGGPSPQYTPNSLSTGDGFNLNAVDITLDKPMDESPWAAGYHVELMTGADSVGNGPAGGIWWGGTEIRQAYLALRTPVANSGIDWKIGVLDSPLGYESSSDPLNPNFTRSLGYNLEPTTLTGIVGAYKINDEFTVQAGVANSGTPGNAVKGGWGVAMESQKAYLGSVAFTAPDSWGWAKGTTLNAGVIIADSGASGTTANGATVLYAGATVPTPLTALKVGAAFDYLDQHNGGAAGNPSDDSAWNVGLYANYQINDKASFNVRGEYLNGNGARNGFRTYGVNAEEFTATMSYQLWANVLSRVEFRWDHVEHGKSFDYTSTGTIAHDNAYLLALNLIYQF
jgi:hypothetical protein